MFAGQRAEGFYVDLGAIFDLGSLRPFAGYVTKPELAGLLPVLYPGVFPNLDVLNKSGKPRADLAAIPPTTSNPNIYGLLGGDAARFHNMIHPRTVDAALVHSAVFPAVTQGEHTLWRDEHTRVGTLSIHGGEVTEHIWDDTPSGQ